MATSTRKRVIVCLPGILARSEEYHKPLYLDRWFDKIEHIGYGRRFDPALAVARAVVLIRDYARVGYDVALLGSSLGGDIAAFVTEQLASDCTDLDDWFSVVVVDAPAGSGTFAAAKKIPSRILRSSVIGAVLPVVGTVTTFVSRQGPGLPKDRLITRPSAGVMSHLAPGRRFSDEQWRKWVKREAKQGLKGHSGTVWARQLQWMEEVFEDGSLDRGVRSMRGHNVTYVQCTKGNDVIVQPQAQQWWLERIGTTNYRTVAAPHCGYLQMQPEFEAVLAPLVQ